MINLAFKLPQGQLDFSVSISSTVILVGSCAAFHMYKKHLKKNSPKTK